MPGVHDGGYRVDTPVEHTSNEQVNEQRYLTSSGERDAQPASLPDHELKKQGVIYGFRR
jgi:hypothetical protein